MQKIAKWITIQCYVDLHSGEILTKYVATNNYRIARRKKETEIKKEFNNKTKNYEYVGYIKYINECTREGHQRKLFEIS